MTQRPPLLKVENLETRFVTDGGTIRAVNGVSFEVGYGETLAIVGESGSGKSVTSLSVMGLLDARAGATAQGRILFEGEDLITMPPSQVRAIRGKDISMIFQEPMTSLNPVYTIGEQIAEAMRVHQKADNVTAMKRAVQMLDMVGISEPSKRALNFPHQLSGGMRQRVMIAMALSCNPKLLIADEPTTALDVTIQAQILELMRDLQRETGMSILFITHDLGVVAEIADRVLVMYAARVVEEGPVNEIFAHPRMPYTVGLLNSVPRVNRKVDGEKMLYAIPGNIPAPTELPQGCSFNPRCEYTQSACTKEVPPFETVAPNHKVRCLYWQNLDLRSRRAQP